MYTNNLRNQRIFVVILLVVFLTFTFTGTVHALTRNLSLTIADTSEPGSSDTPNGSSGNERPVMIGEVVTYSLNFEIDEGINNGVNIVVAIPDGLQYTGEPEDVSFNNDSGWLDVPSVTGGASSGADLTFDFGTINNTDVDANLETITITFDVIVNNIAANQDGTILAVNATLNNDSAPAETSETRSVKVIEPDLALTVLQRDDYNGNPVTTGDAGDPVVYTIRITNNGNAPAYNLDLTDFIPVSYVTRHGLYALTGSPSPSIFYTPSNGEWIVSWSYINPGTSVSITARTTVNNSVAPEDSWTNTADIICDSLPDDDGSDNNVPGLPGSTTGLRNDYAETATTPAYSVPTIDVVNQVEYPAFTPVATTIFPGGYSDSTSDPNTGISAYDASRVDLTIGETVNFIITVTYPEGTTPEASIVDMASPYNTGITGTVIELVSAQVVHTGSNLSGTGVPGIGSIWYPLDFNGDGDGSVLEIPTGSRDILNTPDGVVDDNDRIVIRVTARLDDEDESGGTADALSGVYNVEGRTSRNRIQIAWNRFSNTENVNANVEIVEPALTISKSTISGANLSAGDSAVFELTISNTGTAPAYTVMVRDDFPGGGTPNLVFDSVDAANSTCVDIAGFGLFSGSASYMDFRIGQLNAGSSCTIRFSGTVQNNITSDTTYTNTASISSYDSLSNSSDADNRNYSGNGSVTSTFRTSDTTLPVVTVPSNITGEATGASGAVVTFSASATDDIDGSLTPTCSPASGSTFTLGTTTVNCSATDNAGNTGSDSFTVTVQDTTNPTVSVPANIIEEATSASGAAVTFTVSANDIVDGAMTPSCDANSGDTFSIGTTTVNCSATDNAGNTGNNSFMITVEDSTGPTITVPANITEEATSPSGNTVTYSVSASDLVDGPVPATCSPTSGSTFPLGTTTVNCSANDSEGNPGSNSFTITIEDTTAPSVTIEQGASQPDPANSSPIVFDVVFSEDVTGFDDTDVNISGMAAAATVVVTSTGTGDTYTVEVSGMADGETVTATIPSDAALDVSNNGNAASTSTDNSVAYDTSGPSVTIEQGAAQLDPANSSPIVFDVVFSEDVINFDDSDVDISGMAATPTIVVTSTGTGDTYTVEVSGMADGETVTATIPSDAAEDTAGNQTMASSSIDNSVTYDTDSINLFSGGILGEPQDKIIRDSGEYGTHFTGFVIHFSESAYDPAGDSDSDDVTNPNNYLLIQSGINKIYDTTSCLAYSNNGDNVLGDDTQISVDSVLYDDATFTATVEINNGVPLAFGQYRLLLCGTTSITDLAGNSFNNGSDLILTFSIVPLLPDTGFPQGEITQLSDQPAAKAYGNIPMTLEIPTLGVSMPIVSVPKTAGEWDVTWLSNSAGYLEGSAFPTWEGNTVITGHVWDAFNQPGGFADLKSLKYGDRIQIQAWGQTYTYEVRETKLISNKDLEAAFESETYDWLTLVTCEFYTPSTGEYLYRRMVRAVLVSIE